MLVQQRHYQESVCLALEPINSPARSFAEAEDELPRSGDLEDPEAQLPTYQSEEEGMECPYRGTGRRCSHGEHAPPAA